MIRSYIKEPNNGVRDLFILLGVDTSRDLRCRLAEELRAEPLDSPFVEALAEQAMMVNITTLETLDLGVGVWSVIINCFSDNIHRLFVPRERFPVFNAAVQDIYKLAKECYVQDKLKKNPWCILVMVMCCKTDDWLRFVNVCLQTYSSDWLYFFTFLLSTFDVNNLQTNEDQIKQALDNLLVMCFDEIDPHAVLYSAYHFIINVLEDDARYDFLSWFAANKPRIIAMRKKYLQVDPIERLSARYETICEVLQQETNLAHDINNIILKMM